MKRVLLITFATGIFLVYFGKVISLTYADVYYAQSQRLLTKGYYSEALELSDKSLLTNPEEPRYFYGKTKILLAKLPDTSKEEALNLLIEAENISPENLVTLRNIAPFYYFLAIKDLQGLQNVENIDQEYLPVAATFLEDLSTRYPDDAGVQVLVAKYEKRLGLQELYENKIEKIRKLRPDLLDWYPEI